MTSARLVLTLALLLAPSAAAQATAAEPPAWEGQFSDGQVTVTLYPRGEAVAGSIDIGGSFHLLRAKVAPGGGQLSGTFFAGAAGFGFDARLDQDVLLLKSGGKSLRLKRRAAAQAGAGAENPLTAPPRKAPAADDGPDLGHVKVGQRYVYDLQNDLQQVWTVKEVGADFVKYEIALIMGGNPLGDPAAQEWRYVAPPAGQGRAAAPQPPDVKVSRERVTVSGVELDCMVSEASGYKSWVAMSPGSDTVWTFPGVVKTVQLSDGSVIMELKEIEE